MRCGGGRLLPLGGFLLSAFVLSFLVKFLGIRRKRRSHGFLGLNGPIMSFFFLLF